MTLTDCNTEKVSYCFSSHRGQATPHWNVHYRLSYASDKFIKNTIWMGLSFVLYFQYYSFLSCPTEISALICVTLFTKPHCQNPASCVCLSSFPLRSFGYISITIVCAMSKRQRGTAWAEITFSPPCT